MSKCRDPLNLHYWEDPYTLGAFVEKARLHRYAGESFRFLRVPDPHTAKMMLLYRKGISDASLFTWDDLAYELAMVRNRNSQRFDSFLSTHSSRTFAIVSACIRDAHDWETSEQIRIGHELGTAPRAPTSI